MKSYAYHTGTGTRQYVRAASVGFTQNHVVFRDNNGRIVLAELAQDCRQLTEAVAEGQATRAIPVPGEE